jgi:hypothetical protein
MSIEPFADFFVLPTALLEDDLERLSIIVGEEVQAEDLLRDLFATVHIWDEAEVGLEILGYELGSRYPELTPKQFTRFTRLLFAMGMELCGWLSHLQLYRRGVCPYVAVERRSSGLLLKRRDVYLRDLKHEFNTRARSESPAQVDGIRHERTADRITRRFLGLHR